MELCDTSTLKEILEKNVTKYDNDFKFKLISQMLEAL